MRQRERGCHSKFRGARTDTHAKLHYDLIKTKLLGWHARAQQLEHNGDHGLVFIYKTDQRLRMRDCRQISEPLSPGRLPHPARPARRITT